MCFIWRPLHFPCKSYSLLFLFLYYLYFGTFLFHVISNVFGSPAIISCVLKKNSYDEVNGFPNLPSGCHALKTSKSIDNYDLSNDIIKKILFMRQLFPLLTKLINVSRHRSSRQIARKIDKM